MKKKRVKAPTKDCIKKTVPQKQLIGEKERISILLFCNTAFFNTVFKNSEAQSLKFQSSAPAGALA